MTIGRSSSLGGLFAASLNEEVRLDISESQTRDTATRNPSPSRKPTPAQLLLFSTETGDAWLLDPSDHLAARLARVPNRLARKLSPRRTGLRLHRSPQPRIDHPRLSDAPPQIFLASFMRRGSAGAAFAGPTRSPTARTNPPAVERAPTSCPQPSRSGATGVRRATSRSPYAPDRRFLVSESGPSV